MLPEINNIFTLSKDPELIHTANDKTICRLSLACNEKYGDKETALFLSGVAFGNGGVAISNHFRKGSKIFISGKLSPNNFEKDGKTVYGYQLIVKAFEFVDRKPKQDSHNESKSNGYQKQDNFVYEPEEDLPF